MRQSVTIDRAATDAPAASDLHATLRAARTDRGDSLAELSAESPLLLVLVRHSGCTFCGHPPRAIPWRSVSFAKT